MGLTIVYTGRITANAFKPIAKERRWREMATPPVWPPKNKHYALDNGAFIAHRDGKEWDQAKYEQCLTWAEENRMPDWTVAPDILGGGWESWQRSEEWRPQLQARGFKVYLAVQDGMKPGKEMGVYDGIFVGGTTRWKLDTGPQWAEFAHYGRQKCHVGRVGTYPRVLWAARINADSIDSNQMLWSKRDMQLFCDGLDGRQVEMGTEVTLP